MFGVRHNLAEEFPEFEHTIQYLKFSNPEFAGLIEQYDGTDKKIYGLEQQNLPVSDDYLGKLKKRRVELKDRLYNLLKNHYGSMVEMSASG